MKHAGEHTCYPLEQSHLTRVRGLKLQWFETPEETKQRHAMENAQRALKAFTQRYGGE